jgi:arylsulfatase A-like enzyme
MIVIDDLNDWVGYLNGHPQVKTPNIDKLAQHGVGFTNCQASAPMCLPSRVSFMSGLRVASHGVYTNQDDIKKAERYRNAVKLNEHLSNHNYLTMQAGKIYHHKSDSGNKWDKSGGGYPWDRHPVIGESPHSGKRYPSEMAVSDMPGARPGLFDWGPVDMKDEEMGDYYTAEWAQQQLVEKHEQPFFMAVGFKWPHQPWYAPKKYFDMLPPTDKIKLPPMKEDDLEDIPESGRKCVKRERRRFYTHKSLMEENEWKPMVKAYLACIAFVDAMVGKVLDAVKNGPNADNTVIMLFSDNGYHLGEKTHWRKYALWNEASRVPMVVAGPGVKDKGRKCHEPVSFTDIFPTLCDVAGIEKPYSKSQLDVIDFASRLKRAEQSIDGKLQPQLDGVSFYPLLCNSSAESPRPALTTSGYGNHSVCSSRWRYIRYNDGSEELYDHKNDPEEWNNLANDSSYEVVKKEHIRWLPAYNAQPAR